MTGSATQIVNLLNAVQESKLYATTDTWVHDSLVLAQRLAEHDLDTLADQMRATHTLAAHRTACAEISLVLYNLWLDDEYREE